MNMNSTPESRLHARVIGKVQGVGFRYFVLNAATELGLTGWVRNRRDGSVEVLAEGDMDHLKDLVGVLNRGSRSSNVKEVKTKLQTATGEFGSFYVSSTL